MSFRTLPPTAAIFLAVMVALFTHLAPHHARAADKGKLEAFLRVTGYDVVIESLQQGAMAGPGLVGDAPKEFGEQYSALAKKVFDPDEMRNRAIDILAAVMPDELLNAGAEFYASDLGQRLVEVENASHVADDTQRYAEGQQIVEKLKADDPARLQMLERMNTAIGSEDTASRAIVEIQLHFLSAATAAGVTDLHMSEDELRQALTEGVKKNAGQREMLSLIGNAWTYRDISDDDLEAYTEALETPEMKQLYEILNATEFQVMVERYEVLGGRLGELTPSQDL